MQTISNIKDEWQHCQKAISDGAFKVRDFNRPPQLKPWFDKECRQPHAAKQEAYKAALYRRTRLDCLLALQAE